MRVASLCIICLWAWLCAGPATAAEPRGADELLIVHCLLPGQIRQLGLRTTYVAARRPVRTTALDCRVRGGEYVISDRANLRTALKVWLESAQAGDSEAQTTVGELFEQGVGDVPPDFATARSWYERAAAQGSARALINLGNLYERGLGVAPDAERALQLYRQAANLPADTLAAPLALEATEDVAPVVALLERQTAELERTLGSLRAETGQLRTELDETQQALERALRAAVEQAAEQQRDDIAEQARRVDAYQSDIAERDARIAELTESVSRLRTDQSAAEAMAGELESLRELIAAQQTELTSKDAQLEQRERLTEEHAAAAQRLLAEIQGLRSETEGRRTATPVTADVNLAGPTVTLVDPVLPTSRGLVRITLPLAAAERRIVGRVSAPAGLLSLTLNDRPIDSNAAGVFSHVVQEGEAHGDIRITAIDQQGKRADLQFGFAAQPPAATTPKLRLGRFHALLIGNSRYRHLPQLKTPHNDIARLQAVLTQRYGFAVDVLEDATRYEMLSALNRIRSRLTSDDNLLIYYAGHGELDRTNMRGHWLPVDAEPDSTANWVSNVAVTDIINVINARQIMLVVDSCYSGTLTRSSLANIDGAMTESEQATWLEMLSKKKARVVLTSGGLAPVLDVGGGQHSVFANAFLKILESNADLLTGRSLYQAVAARVAHAASEYDFEQIPAYAPIARSGHEAGDFMLLPTRL